MSSKKPEKQDYSAKDIQSLTPREHVRLRPGMYIGGTNKRAFHHLLWETVDNAIDEAMVGSCTEIRIILHSDTKVSVIDNGRGIPMDEHQGRYALEIVMTEMGAGKFDNESYKVRGGLHGVGVSAINALSAEMVAEVKRDGFLWRQTYKEGLVTSPVERIRPLVDSESSGASITFTPDFTVMEKGLTFDYDLIVERCRELAYLLPDVTFSIEQEDNLTDSIVIRKANGLTDWVADLNNNQDTVHPILTVSRKTSYERRDRMSDVHIKVNFALQFRKHGVGLIKSFVNSIETQEDGSHITGLKKGFLSAIYNDAANIDDSLKGLVVVIHIYHGDPQFEGSMTRKLFNPELQFIMENCVKELLAENPDVLDKLQEYFQR